MVRYGTVWYCIVLFGPVWSRMDSYGPVLSSMVLYCPVWYSIVPYGSLWSCMVRICPEWFCMVQFGPIWSSMVLHGISDNYASQHEITQNSIRKLEKNKKALNSTIFHGIANDDTRYLMLDSILYHEIAIESSFSNKLYPCTILGLYISIKYQGGCRSTRDKYCY